MADIAVMHQLRQVAAGQPVVGLGRLAIGLVGETVADDHFAGRGVDIGEGIVDMRDAVERDMGDKIFPRVVDRPGRIITDDRLVGLRPGQVPTAPTTAARGDDHDVGIIRGLGAARGEYPVMIGLARDHGLVGIGPDIRSHLPDLGEDRSVATLDHEEIFRGRVVGPVKHHAARGIDRGDQVARRPERGWRGSLTDHCQVIDPELVRSPRIIGLVGVDSLHGQQRPDQAGRDGEIVIRHGGGLDRSQHGPVFKTEHVVVHAFSGIGGLGADA